MDSAISLKNVEVSIKGRPILQQISGSIASGKVTGILGPSGAGKTTLLRALLGLQPLHKGSIRIFNLPAGDNKLRSQIGYVTQAASVYPDLTVQENVSYFATLLGQEKLQVQQIISLVELTPQLNQIVGSLSGGQKARVSLAVALLGQPKLLLLDEPTVGLDPRLRLSLWHLFHKLTEQGTAIVISSHAMDEAEKCDQLWFVRQGKLLTTGAPAQILNQTKCESMEQAFLSLSSEGGNEF